MQTDDNSEQLDLLMSSLNAIKKELRAIKTNMTFESKLAYTNQDLMAMFDDRDPLRNKSFIERIFGKLVGDKGYICRDLFSRLFVDGIQLITKLKSNMKGQLMTVSDKILLRKRALIETINGELKNIAQIEHSRHRSVVGFTVNLMAGLAAYSFFPKKPMIDVERVPPYENGVIQLSLF